MASVIPAGLAPRPSPSADAPALTDGQDIRNRLDLCTSLTKMARDAGIPPELLFMTMGVETGFRQHSGGDRDSVGLFQQRPSSGWGSSAHCYNPITAAQYFIQRAAAYRGKFGSSANELGAWCQKVQGSAFPEKYQNLLGEARRCVTAVDANAPPGGKDVASGGGNGSNLSTTDGSSGGYGGSSSFSPGGNLGGDPANPYGLTPTAASLMASVLADDQNGIEDRLKQNFLTLGDERIQKLAKTVRSKPGLARVLEPGAPLSTYIKAHPDAVDALASQNVKDVDAVLAAAGVPDGFKAQASPPLVIAPAVPQSNLPGDATLAAEVAKQRGSSQRISG